MRISIQQPTGLGDAAIYASFAGTDVYLVEGPVSSGGDSWYYSDITPPDGGPYAVVIRLASDLSVIGNDIVFGDDVAEEATTGSGDYTLMVGEVLRESLENLRAVAFGEDIETEQVSSLLRTFNIAIKSFQAQTLALWTWRHAALFLTKDTAGYLLGPTGSNAAETYVATTLAVDAAASDAVVTLTSTTGINDGDYIGIVLDDGGVHWSTINAAAGTTISSGLPSDAAAGNTVFAYTTKIERPLEIKDVRLLRLTGDEKPCNVIPMSEYNAYPIKNTSSEVVNVAYEPLVGNALIHVWPLNAVSTEVLKFQYKKPTATVTSFEDVVSFPADCYNALVLEITSKLAPKYGTPMAEMRDWERKAKMALEEMHDFEDDTSISFAPMGGCR
jgi:hypothetical protein